MPSGKERTLTLSSLLAWICAYSHCSAECWKPCLPRPCQSFPSPAELHPPARPPPLSLLMPYALIGFVLSPTPQPSLRARIHEWHLMESLCPHTGCDTHGVRFSSSSWKSRSTFQADSMKIGNRFSSRKLQGKLNSIYFKEILFKFQLLKSQKTAFLALRVIHILKLCPWGPKMRYFTVLLLGNTHQKYEWGHAQHCSQFTANNMVPKKTPRFCTN